jgi:hypothetical protein
MSTSTRYLQEIADLIIDKIYTKHHTHNDNIPFWKNSEFIESSIAEITYLLCYHPDKIPILKYLREKGTKLHFNERSITAACACMNTELLQWIFESGLTVEYNFGDNIFNKFPQELQQWWILSGLPRKSIVISSKGAHKN